METFTITILTPGGFTTVQDSGRFGFQHMGIPVNGALDAFSFQVANLLVGNPLNAAALEITIMGPRLEIHGEMDIALTGATMGFTVNEIPVEGWRSIRVKPGDIVNIQQVQNGCRAYLSVSGGIDVPVVMGSRSTYTGGHIGGYHGRPLKAGDILKAASNCRIKNPRTLPENRRPVYSTEIQLRSIPGPQDDFFETGMIQLFSSEFMVTPKADRMGYRLMGPAIRIKKGMPKSIISEPSMPGGIQIPPDEQPIILLVEQTVGGYAKIATVISADLPLVAQATPGDTIRFEQTDLDTAHLIYHEQKATLEKIAEEFASRS